MSTQDLVIVTTHWCYSAAQHPPGGLEGKPASASEGVRAMSGESRKEGVLVQDFKKVQG